VSRRVRKDSVHPPLPSGASGRPLNFTVRGRAGETVGDIEFLTGFTSDVPSFCRWSFTFGIGSPPLAVSMTALGVPPFENNEYVALAVRRAYLFGSGYVALAYRRLGQGAGPHAASSVPSVVAAIIGLMGLVNFALLPLSEGLVAASLVGIVVGIGGCVRLRDLTAAKRRLSAWRPPDTLTNVGGGREAR